MLIMDQSQFIALGERGEGDLRKITWFFKGNEGPVISNRVQGGGGGEGAVKIDSQYREIIRILQSLVRETGKYNCGETHNQNLPTPFPSPPQAINDARSLTPYIELDCKPRKKG